MATKPSAAFRIYDNRELFRACFWTAIVAYLLGFLTTNGVWYLVRLYQAWCG